MPFNTRTLKLLREALARRQPLRKVTNALRLVNAKGDHLEGLVLEQYGKHFVAQVFSPFWLREAVSLMGFLKNYERVDYFIIKDRIQSASSNPRDIKTQVLAGGFNSCITVCENGLHFEVDLNDTLNTGLFLDMRANRKLVGQNCKNKKVLNCFSYTCSFGIYSRVYGAREVMNIDINKKALERARTNYNLNGLKIQPQEFVRADVAIFLERALRKHNYFDVIILDPPSFARADGKVFSVQKDLPKLLKLAISLLNKGGQIFVSTNLSGISHRNLEETLKKADQNRPKKFTRLGQDVDFPGSGQVKESHLAALWVEY